MRAAALVAALCISAGAAPAAEGYVVQLASVKSEQQAQGIWARLRQTHPLLLGDMELSVQQADLGARGTFYRVQIGPFPNQATAEDMCLQLRAQRQDCLVARR